MGQENDDEHGKRTAMTRTDYLAGLGAQVAARAGIGQTPPAARRIPESAVGASGAGVAADAHGGRVEGAIRRQRSRSGGGGSGGRRELRICTGRAGRHGTTGDVDCRAACSRRNGWALHGRVFNTQLQPISGLTVFLVDASKTYQQAYGFAYTDDTGYFLLNYSRGKCGDARQVGGRGQTDNGFGTVCRSGRCQG